MNKANRKELAEADIKKLIKEMSEKRVGQMKNDQCITQLMSMIHDYSQKYLKKETKLDDIFDSE